MPPPQFTHLPGLHRGHTHNTLTLCLCVSRQLCATAQEQAQAQPSTSRITPGDYIVEEKGAFSISKVSFGSILTPIGLTLLGYGFCAYFADLPLSPFSSLMLIYGFPISLLGAALSYAQVG